MFLRYLVLIGLLGLTVSCQGPQKKSVSSQATKPGTIEPDRLVYIEGRITVEDLLKKKNHTVKVEAFLVKNKKLRIEANGPLGVRVASVLVSENQIQAQLYLERKYLSGNFPNVWKNDNPTLRPISIPVSPLFMQTVFLQERNLGPNWKCERDNVAEECLNMNAKQIVPKDGTRLPQQPQKMTWIRDEKGLTRFFAESSAYRLMWEPSAQMQYIENNPKIFTMDVNDAFKKVDITPR